MRRQAQLLSALALSAGLTLSTSFQAVTLIPGQIVDQVLLLNLAPMLEKVLPAVVSVRVGGATSQGQKIPEEFKKFFGDDLPDQPIQPFEGLGSGVIINANRGYVLASNHATSQAQKISIQLNDGRRLDAKLVGSDDQSDITLLRIQNPSKLIQIATADSDRLCVGDFATAVGDPFGLGQTTTSGIISALGCSGLNLEGLENFIQTDASINRGNSGGALLSPNSGLIGVNTATLAPGDGNVGVGFAIPSSIARTLAQRLIDLGKIRRGLLDIKGIEMGTDITKVFNFDMQRGTFVSKTLPDSGSVKVGVKTGDIITSLDGKPLNSFAKLHPRIATTEPGIKMKFGLLHNDKPLEVEVTLGTNTSSSANAEATTSTLEGATPSDDRLKGSNESIKIGEVVKGSLAAQAGLQKDDAIIGVNRDRVNSIAEMRKVLVTKPAIIAL